jgi:hypothetical protein
MAAEEGREARRQEQPSRLLYAKAVLKALFTTSPFKDTEFEFKEDGEIVVRTVDKPKRHSAVR